MIVLSKKLFAVAALGEAHALNFSYAFGFKKHDWTEKSEWTFFSGLTPNHVVPSFAPDVACISEVFGSRGDGGEETEKLGQGSYGAVHTTSIEVHSNNADGPCVKRPILAQKTTEATKETKDVTKMVIEKLFQEPLLAHESGVVPLLAGRQVDRNLQLLMPKAWGSLKDLLQETKYLAENPGLAEALIEDIKKGIKFMHGKNVAHLDIKPANILLFEEKKDGNTVMRAKLADFDLAEDMSKLNEKTVGDVYGAYERKLTSWYRSPGIMAQDLAFWSATEDEAKKNVESSGYPKREIKEVLEEADWWAFHCVVYEVITASEEKHQMMFPQIHDPLFRGRVVEGISHEQQGTMPFSGTMTYHPSDARRTPISTPDATSTTGGETIGYGGYGTIGYPSRTPGAIPTPDAEAIAHAAYQERLQQIQVGIGETGLGSRYDVCFFQEEKAKRDSWSSPIQQQPPIQQQSFSQFCSQVIEGIPCCMRK